MSPAHWSKWQEGMNKGVVETEGAGTVGSSEGREVEQSTGNGNQGTTHATMSRLLSGIGSACEPSTGRDY